MRIKLEELMVAFVAAGLPRLKDYADKIYNNGVIITAGYSLRTNPGGLQQWQFNLNRIMSDMRVAVEWSFGKIVGRNKFVAYGSPMKIQLSPVVNTIVLLFFLLMLILVCMTVNILHIFVWNHRRWRNTSHKWTEDTYLFFIYNCF
jgi:hypothetical protein